jgi:AcrR family transcriptional regulator
MPVRKARKPAKKRPYHHGNLRDGLIEASLQLIEKKGIKGLTLREIGAALGVSRMAAYRHFADKAALLAAISEAGFEQFAEALDAAKASAGPDFSSQLSALALAYVRFAAAHRAHYEVMFSSAADVPEPVREPSEAAKRAFGILEQTICEGQRNGNVREGDSITLARHVWAHVHGISTLRLEPDLSEHGAGTRFVLFCAELLQAGLVRVS